MDSKKILETSLEEHFYFASIFDNKLKNKIIDLASSIISVLEKGGTIFWCGNGGSSADSQHLSAELLGRFKIKDSSPYSSISLSTDASLLTCLSNDYSFDNIFERQIDALGNQNDMLIILTTSGKSCNVLNAIKKAKMNGLLTAGFLGGYIEDANPYLDHCISINSSVVARIQEMHMLIGHIICEIVERKLT